MANNPVDRDVSYMQEHFGTTKLVTDYGATTPTNEKKENNPPEDRLKKFCGGKHGFDDYVEWLV